MRWPREPSPSSESPFATMDLAFLFFPLTSPSSHGSILFRGGSGGSMLMCLVEEARIRVRKYHQNQPKRGCPLKSAASRKRAKREMGKRSRPISCYQIGKPYLRPYRRRHCRSSRRPNLRPPDLGSFNSVYGGGREVDRAVEEEEVSTGEGDTTILYVRGRLL